MEMWFSDIHTPNIKLNIRVKKQLFSERSDIQQVDVFDSEDLGKFISLDGEVVFSEKDEFIYDEMVAHVPMAVHPHVRNVLVIGGGDGGVAKELCRYPEIERIDVVEEDEMFVYVSRTFFPETAAGLTDKRVNLYIQDGLKFLRGKVGEYDLIINDSTDPFGPTEGLFTKEFYGSCFKALHGLPARQSLLCRGRGGVPQDAPEGVPLLPRLQSLSGTHSHLFFGLLAVRLCQQAVSSAEGLQPCKVEGARHSHALLHDQPAHGRIHAAQVCRGHSARRRKGLSAANICPPRNAGAEI